MLNWDPFSLLTRNNLLVIFTRLLKGDLCNDLLKLCDLKPFIIALHSSSTLLLLIDLKLASSSPEHRRQEMPPSSHSYHRASMHGQSLPSSVSTTNSCECFCLPDLEVLQAPLMRPVTGWLERPTNPVAWHWTTGRHAYLCCRQHMRSRHDSIRDHIARYAKDAGLHSVIEQKTSAQL